jgi:hypothetical protein
MRVILKSSLFLTVWQSDPKTNLTHNKPLLQLHLLSHARSQRTRLILFPHNLSLLAQAHFFQDLGDDLQAL